MTFNTSTIQDVAVSNNGTFVQEDVVDHRVTVQRTNGVTSVFTDAVAEVITHKVGPHMVTRALVTNITTGMPLYVSSQVEEHYMEDTRNITREEWAELYALL